MATKETQRPFNLLYKYEPQKSSIDKVYEFVVFQGRMIVMFVMLIIILAFAYRFPLDRKLNDQINLSNDNLKRLSVYAKPDQQVEYKNTAQRINSAEKALKIYTSSDNQSKGEVEGQVKMSDFLKIVRNINESNFKEDIIISDYSYVSNPEINSISGELNSNNSLIINGFTSTFPKAESFRGEIVNQSQYVESSKMQNLGGTKQGEIQFSLEIQFK